ncbi:hypothetical protein PTSG_06674 [Salpingoeca rosetta]|uniref:EF-hand domain-containing protein n=1 Tax=Salpingoeca rosetta (strain ATCC 50818 / BSB-021) TaxID=946362 RepID=F2UFN9_SALR5|nr:uncharacterized protein PTSG_06674 [Salpingoeca rosetta]EGD75607.1 hypothetical protein PTSG_06674 [Salpingoeca rosetta]|eukprot:XP_004992064.1 hypothetical protein PTSG_06674 [Salpingoeca rosetta]
MGCTVSHGLSAEDVEAYETCSFFTATEVIQALQIFVTIANNPKCDDPKSITLPSATVAKWRGLCHNPFARRICDVFSDDDGEFSFDEFLDMLSVFSEHAPKDVKATYAFRIYGAYTHV